HVFLESESHSYFSKALSAEVESVLPHYRSVLATALAWTSSLSILPLFLRLDLGHDGSQFPVLVAKLFCMNLTASSFETEWLRPVFEGGMAGDRILYPVRPSVTCMFAPNITSSGTYLVPVITIYCLILMQTTQSFA